MSEQGAVTFTGVVATKLRPPELPSAVVRRPRLLGRLAEPGNRDVLISAPAGFGKTVLVTEWLRAEQPPYAWLTVDALDGEPKRFTAHIAAAFEALGTAEGGRIADLLRSGAAADATLDPELQEALDALDARVVLVVDDLQYLEQGPSMALLRALVERGVAPPRMVLLTRVDPPLPLGRLRAAGALLELREHDLRFTVPEAADLFDRLLPGGLPPELVERLGQRTEGWIAGLRMAAIALEHAEDRHAAVDAFTGSHRFIVDYLIEEAVGGQPEPVQRFLMETSILGRFTEDTCVAVTGDPDARGILYDLQRANLFLVPLGADHRWYRYHNLFAELLQFRLRRLQPGRAEELQERASRWFEEAGDIAQALEHASRMADRTRVAELLDRHGIGILARSELASLRYWVRTAPDPLTSRFPTFILVVGWLRLLTERAPDLKPLLAAGYALLDAGVPGVDDDTMQAIRYEFDVLRAFDARFGGRYHDALAIGGWLLASLPADARLLRGRVLYNQARAHMMLAEMAPAAELLERGTQDNLLGGTHYLVLTGLGQMGAVLLELEGVPAARRALDAAVRLAEERGLARLPAYSTVQYHLGHVHLTADELDAAEACFSRAVSLGRAGGMVEGLANGLAGLARVRAARGAMEEAEQLVAQVELLDRTENVVLVSGDVGVERARLALLPGVPTAPRAARGAGHADPGDATEWSIAEESRHLLGLVLALRHGDADGRSRAARLAARIRHGSGHHGRHVALCVVELAEALLAEGDDRWPRLDAALADAAARGYVRPLLDFGEPLRRLLEAAQARSLSPAAREHSRILLARLGGEAAPLEAHAALPPLESLTEREREVLHLICRGLSNKAIARTMFVSAETVKTHLKHIYDKLEVSDRRSAALRAREAGLAEPPPA